MKVRNRKATHHPHQVLTNVVAQVLAYVVTQLLVSEVVLASAQDREEVPTSCLC